MKRSFGLPAELDEALGKGMAQEGFPLEDVIARARDVQALSDYFLSKPDGATPWDRRETLPGYLAYYFPLNLARLSAVITEAKARGFFAGLDRSVDWGAGPATASLALQTGGIPGEHVLIEKSERPRQFVEKNFPQAQDFRWEEPSALLRRPERTLGVFSYSLTELLDWPAGLDQLEALMILEPSVQKDGRRLLEWRRRLRDKGYHLWAPCTHQGDCPLLTQSPRDWCHDRIFFEAPAWFAKLETHLPMKNQTLTFSYLLARKTPPLRQRAARTIGDTLREKGKDRQMICRGPEREFLAWMHRAGPTQDIPRGSLVEIPESTPKKSNELRVQEPLRLLS